MMMSAMVMAVCSIGISDVSARVSLRLTELRAH
jgi:hypothetical protein